MKLWIIRPVDRLPKDDDPWAPWYDKAFGFVVRAETEMEARSLSHDQAGDENRGTFLGKITAKTNSPWLDAKYSTAEELCADGEPGVIMKDFASA